MTGHGQMNPNDRHIKHTSIPCGRGGESLASWQDPRERRTRRMHVRRGLALSALTLCMVAALVVPYASAQDSHGQNYLRLGVGARAFGMGSAHVAVANDATAGYWNPAGLTEVDDFALSVLGTGGYAFDRSHYYLGAAKTFSALSIGVNWINAGWDDFAGNDAIGGSTGEFDLSDNAIMMSAAKRFDSVALGITGKILDQSISDESE